MLKQRCVLTGAVSNLFFFFFFTDMIVSGLPTRNGDQHAGEVCTTAMDLLHAIGSFQIRHMKNTKLQLRIGIHTGV